MALPATGFARVAPDFLVGLLVLPAVLVEAGVVAFFLFAASADEGPSSETSAEAARKSRRFNRLSGKRRIPVARS